MLEFKDLLARKESSEEYRYFTKPKVRENIYTFCKELTEYLHREKIPNIIILDRSARPAWVGIDEYWKLHFKNEPRPGIYFVNPDGFNSVRKTIKEQNMSEVEVLFDSLLLASTGDSLIVSEKTKHDENNRKQFENAYKLLEKQKEKPLAIFDNCIHTGATIIPVLHYLYQNGYKDIRIAVADTKFDSSGVRVDKELGKTTMIACSVFGFDNSGVEKGDNVTSGFNEDADRKKVTASREEIRRIIRENES